MVEDLLGKVCVLSSCMEYLLANACVDNLRMYDSIVNNKTAKMYGFHAHTMFSAGASAHQKVQQALDRTQEGR